MSWPVIEPELPPLSQRRSFHVTALVVVLAVAVAAVVVVVVRSGGGGSTAKSKPPLPAPGRLVAYDEKTGRLVVERPDGRHRAVDSELLTDRPIASPDGRFVLTFNGADLFTVADGRISRRHSPLPSAGSQGSIPGQPFADHDRWLMSPTTFGSNKLSLVPTSGGRSRALGTGDSATADPVAPGIYVSIAKGRPLPLPDEPQIQVTPDVRVERRIIGQPTRVIATAARLNRLAGVPPSVKLLISATPSPHGRAVLVYARALTGTATRTLLAVFDTRGRLVDDVSAAHITGGDWSSDDSHIAYQTGQADRLVVWQPASQQTNVINVPPISTRYYDCAWSPDGDWIACAGGRDPLSSTPTRRLIVDVAHRRAQSTPSSDSPLVWLP